MLIFQNKSKSSTLWRCSVRSKAIGCPVTVRQIGDRFVTKHTDHVHPADIGRRLKAVISVKVGHVINISLIVEKAYIRGKGFSQNRKL